MAIRRFARADVDSQFDCILTKVITGEETFKFTVMKYTPKISDISYKTTIEYCSPPPLSARQFLFYYKYILNFAAG